jgi:adenylate cyclase
MTPALRPEPGLAPSHDNACRAWSAFVRLELLGRIDSLVGLADLLAQEADGKRPDDYLADVAKLRQASARLRELAQALMTIEAPAPLEKSLSQARHDLGNRLNQVSGLVQLLQIQEDNLLGAFSTDLEKMLRLCRECEAGLLGQGSRADGEAPADACGMSEKEIALVVEQIVPLGPEATANLIGRVLVADDSPLSREVLSRLLRQHGHSVVEADSGQEALRLLAEQPFDVLLLDLVMPGMTGFEVLQQLRDEGRLRRTSVVVISALDEIHGVARCLESGADDYLNKPVDRVLLRARINSCLLKRRQRAQELEQFFPPEVVGQLLDRPDLLQAGRTREVTMLFCDIRGFSRVSERLRNTPEKMVQWISSVMETLDECVLRHQGVLVDFIGDELLTMWGAPQPQADHAERACRAALDMVECMARLSDDWLPAVGEETSVGIGINSGPVSVGNIGTKRRFKYGALGNTVNLASRIQGATKYLKARILITQSTRDQLGADFDVRRLAQLQVVNINQPVSVYELAPRGEPGWEELKAGYEKALALFEQGPDHLQEAAGILGRMVAPFGLRGPNLFLMSRVLMAMQDRNTWSSVYVLPGK